MWDFSFKTSLIIIMKTWPFLVMRAIVYGVFVLIFCGLIASGAIIGHEMGPALTNFGGTQSAIFGALGGFGLAGLVIRILREYSLYLVKAGHIAIMGDMLAGKKVESGFAQLSQGADAVRSNFAETSTLFVFDQLIKGVLKVIDKFMRTAGSFIPFLAPIIGILQTIVNSALTYIDEMILAHIMRNRPANPWRAGADALVIYMQNGKMMFKNAFWLACFVAIMEIAILAVVIFLVPMPELVFGGEDASLIIRIFTGMAVILVSALIFFEPFAVCTMLQVFNKVADQNPDPDMEAWLADKSEAFRELRAGKPETVLGAVQPAE